MPTGVVNPLPSPPHPPQQLADELQIPKKDLTSLQTSRATIDVAVQPWLASVAENLDINISKLTERMRSMRPLPEQATDLRRRLHEIKKSRDTWRRNGINNTKAHRSSVLAAIGAKLKQEQEQVIEEEKRHQEISRSIEMLQANIEAVNLTSSADTRPVVQATPIEHLRTTLGKHLAHLPNATQLSETTRSFPHAAAATSVADG